MAFGVVSMGHHGGQHSRPSVTSPISLNSSFANTGFIASFKMFETIDVRVFGIGIGVVVGVCFGFWLRGWVGVVFVVVVCACFDANKVIFGVYANDVGKTIGGRGIGDGLRVGVVVVCVDLGVSMVVIGGDVVVGLSILIAIKICSCFFIIDFMVFTIVFKDEIDLS
ncbi:hypothetical protein QVD17_37995 [Tagetes erecta]|uniref:Transmembrane protein n=1 Tax=Tagetes erecta TaxID=13708 RepID=A0AAD8JZB2_TARER|nr:hypothetical protein QVD17_37995 [Tagetes erecta]